MVADGTVKVFACHELSRKKPWVAAFAGSVPFTMVSTVLPVDVGVELLSVVRVVLLFAGSFLQAEIASKPATSRMLAL
jgi:hypothetical protein